MTRHRIYLKRPPLPILLDWAFAQFPACKTLVVWSGDLYESFTVPQREGTTMNLTIEYLWDLLKVDQQQVEAAHTHTPGALRFVDPDNPQPEDED